MPTPYWFNVIRRAITKLNKGQPPFTQDHIQRSASWVTCACGKQDPRIRRSGSGCPYDSDLEDLGSDFYFSVLKQRPHEAREILDKIEVRAGELLRDFEKENA